MTKKILGLICVGFAGLVGWVAWGPALHFFLSLIPATAAYAWIGKLLCVGLVAWMGGIGLPLVCLIGAVMCFFTDN